MNNSAAEISFRIAVFSKPGCPKCRTLHKRIDKLLQKPEWQGFTKVSFDLGDIGGLVEFCKTECINPQRLPALAVQAYDPQLQEYRYIPHRLTEAEILTDSYQLYSFIGLQTDYRAGGTITPAMIENVLSRAQEQLMHQQESAG